MSSSSMDKSTNAIITLASVFQTQSGYPATCSTSPLHMCQTASVLKSQSLKIVLSRGNNNSEMPPLAPTQPKIIIKKMPSNSPPVVASTNHIKKLYNKYALLNYTTGVNNSYSHMEKKTDALPTYSTQLSQYKVLSTLSTTCVTQVCSTTQSHSASFPVTSTALKQQTVSRAASSIPCAVNDEFSKPTIDPSDSLICNTQVLSERNIGKEECLTFQHDEINSSSSQGCGEGFNISEAVVVVPKGWNRVFEKGAIIYLSPNKSRIRSYDDVIEYMESDSTCKCGLKCPVRPKELFNFDPNVSSRLGMADFEAAGTEERKCNACKEFDILLSTSLAAKREGKRKRQGRIKCVVDEAEKNPDRKKIFLTGASPLEMFQSGMKAIHSSVLHSKKCLPVKQKCNLVATCDILPVDEIESSSGTTNTESGSPSSTPTVITNNFGDSGEFVVESSSESTITFANNVASKISNVCEEQVGHVETSFQSVATSHLANSNSRKSYSQTHTISEKNTFSPQMLSAFDLNMGIAGTIASEPTIITGLAVSSSARCTAKSNWATATTLQSKKMAKRAIPHANVKNAHELKLCESNTSSVVTASGSKVNLSAGGNCMRLTPSDTSTGVSSPELLSSYTYKSICNSLTSTSSPPPNITVSTSNQLPQALVDQLVHKYTPSNDQKPGHPLLVGGRSMLQPAVCKYVSSVDISHDVASTGMTFSKVMNCPLRTMITPSSNIHHNPSSPVCSPSQIDTTSQPIMLVQLVTQNAAIVSPTLTNVSSTIVSSHVDPQSPHEYNQELQTKFGQLDHRLSHTKSSPFLQQQQQKTVHITDLTVVSRNTLCVNSFQKVQAESVRHTSPLPSFSSSNVQTNLSYVQGKNCVSNTSEAEVHVAPATKSANKVHDLVKSSATTSFGVIPSTGSSYSKDNLSPPSSQYSANNDTSVLRSELVHQLDESETKNEDSGTQLSPPLLDLYDANSLDVVAPANSGSALRFTT